MTQQYQVLARKYRPKNFHELIGQNHVSQALINAIDYNRLHHAYLFTGTRGVGKTTIARILSKCLNCDTGVTSTPCGICANCVAIDQGRFIDLIEIDAASRTKVEDTRELLDNVPYAPSQGRYKVYLIDEVHMLSTHSFNALLKTLEEPPEHVKFLLATTDPQKLPITIISRCLQFVLRPLPQTLLSEHLANILTQEHVQFTQPALWQLASAAKGSVRDALSLTDQAIAFGQGALDDVTVNAMLGLIDAADLVRLITDIYNHDKSGVAAHIEQMRAQMVDASSMFDGLAELLHQLALTQLLPEVALNINEAQAQTISTLAQHISPDVLQLYYEIVVQARENIKLASTPMQALEMCILRLLAFRPLPIGEIITPKFNDSAIAISKIEQVRAESECQHYDVDYQDTHNSPVFDDESNDHLAVADDNEVTHLHIEDFTASENNAAFDTNEALKEAEVLKNNAALENKDFLEDSVDTFDSNEVTQNLLNEQITNDIYDTKAEVSDTFIEVDKHLNRVVKSTKSIGANLSFGPIIEPEPEVETKSGTVQLTAQTEDPRTLLLCPEQDLTGEWTPEKWDYWLQTARENDSLAEDERALARQGMMTGLCDGIATFITTVDSKHLQTTFEQLASKLQQQFTQTTISLKVNNSNHEENTQTPEIRQKMRVEQATLAAQTLLLASPVMQYLSDRGEGRMGKVKLI